VTRLPENEIADWCLADLRKYNVGTSYVLRGGNRVGIYFLETGAVARPSKVVYDRAHSSIAEVQKGMFDWKEILKEARWFHWTGITRLFRKERPMYVSRQLKRRTKWE
jgi:2-dehydro-3-deoxygluconokinase